MPAKLEELRTLSPRRICLIKPSALGDIVNALPVLSALRQRWPEAWIAWVVNRSLRSLLDGHPALDEVIVYDRGGMMRSPSGLVQFARFLRQLGRGEFDLTVDLQGLLRSGLMTFATRAGVRVGLGDAREGATRFYTHRVDPLGGRGESHAVARLLRLAEVFGADVSEPRFELACDAADRRWAREAMADVPRPRLILNLGARWETKRWPPEHFAAIARRAVATRGAGLVAVGAPEDCPLVEDLRARLDPIPLLDLCGRTTLPQLAALAAESDLVLSNDTGPLHLATAAGVRVVGLYTCTSPRLNGPYGLHAAAIQSRVWCAGSYLKSCDRLDCMRELTPDRVWPLVLSQLETNDPSTGDGLIAPE
jgi:ADP-heptose:LPS heptosyltransferase